MDGAWDVTWLGNTVITGHVWNADNQPGIFANLKQMQTRDKIYIQAWGQVYTYQVQQTCLISSYVSGPVLEHKEGDWIALFTCENYVKFWKGYGYRKMIQAVLVDVSPTK